MAEFQADHERIEWLEEHPKYIFSTVDGKEWVYMPSYGMVATRGFATFREAVDDAIKTEKEADNSEYSHHYSF